MSKRVAYWGNGLTSKNIFTIKLFRLRLELWRDSVEVKK